MSGCFLSMRRVVFYLFIKTCLGTHGCAPIQLVQSSPQGSINRRYLCHFKFALPGLLRVDPIVPGEKGATVLWLHWTSRLRVHRLAVYLPIAGLFLPHRDWLSVRVTVLSSWTWMAMVPSKQVGIFSIYMSPQRTVWQKGNGWSRMTPLDILPVKVGFQQVRMSMSPANTTASGLSRMVPFRSR